MYRHCICIGVLILLSLPLWSQQETGDSAPSPGETFQDCAECPKDGCRAIRIVHDGVTRA